MENFIIIVEPKVQDELAALGFTYTQTEINGSSARVFANTKELQKYLSEKYSDEEWHYIKTNRLCF